MTKHIFSRTSAAPTGRLAGAGKGFFSGIWCLLKEISVREQAAGESAAETRSCLSHGCEILPCPHLLRCRQQPHLWRGGAEEASRYTKVPVRALQAHTCTTTTQSRSTRPASPRIHICACCRRADGLPVSALQVKAKICGFIVLCPLRSQFVVAKGRQWRHLQAGILEHSRHKNI